MKAVSVRVLILVVLLMQGVAGGERRLLAVIPGFTISPYFGEQVSTFTFSPEVRVHINAPSLDSFDPFKPTTIAFFALPNGNTIEQTAGKQLNAGDDWHYDIQHIGAQTRFIRTKLTDRNFVTVYCEANAASVLLSWPTWRSKYANNATLVKALVDSVRARFAAYDPTITLSGHSGGGGFAFSYLNSVSAIPNEITRITFLDSDYNYDNTYGPKLRDWLNAAPDHFLSVLAYNDSVALLNGVPVVSATGGTWYRTRMMVGYLSAYFPFTIDENETFITYTALGGRIKVILKQNPTQAILHTVQVEKNGFIQTMLSGTALEGIGYTYYGNRAYTAWVQSARTLPRPMQIPPRPAGAMTGSQFMAAVASMTFSQRETEIYAQIAGGNIPDFLRMLTKVQASFADATGGLHTIIYEVMPDYLCIGSNDDFCRIPMGPVTAQRLANLFGGAMPTPKLVDHIYTNAPVKLAPVTYTPVGNQNELVAKFVEHNNAIENQRLIAGQPLGTMIGGIKKDVVISNRIADPINADHVVIYGWHQLNGSPIQPVYSGHIASYVDYSHGIRLFNGELLVDSVVMTAAQVLMHPTLYATLSNESGSMTQPSYLKDNTIPAVPKSFGVVRESATSLRLVVKPDSSVTAYFISLNKDGSAVTDTVTVSAASPVFGGLEEDSLYYIKVKGVNLNGTSAFSELLAAIPSSRAPELLIVNGFDRASTGNTYSFIRQHAPVLTASRRSVASCTNEAVIDGLFSLTDFPVVDYILGEESTVDETFNSAEQAKVKTYLQNGGKLLVSGCEIAWDLDYKGSTADKDFINNFLKMKYVADAPNGVSATTYQAAGLAGTPLADIGTFSFDNGTHGTIDVKWPDVVRPTAGGVGCARYTTLDTSGGFAGVAYQGLFPSGSVPGKLIALGFPFETVYDAGVRQQLATAIRTFFEGTVDVNDHSQRPTTMTLFQNFPNPFNPTTAISYQLSAMSHVNLVVYDVLGREVAVLVNNEQPAGSYVVSWDARHQPSGVYFCRLSTGIYDETNRMVLTK